MGLCFCFCYEYSLLRSAGQRVLFIALNYRICISDSEQGDSSTPYRPTDSVAYYMDTTWSLTPTQLAQRALHFCSEMNWNVDVVGRHCQQREVGNYPRVVGAGAMEHITTLG